MQKEERQADFGKKGWDRIMDQKPLEKKKKKKKKGGG